MLDEEDDEVEPRFKDETLICFRATRKSNKTILVEARIILVFDVDGERYSADRFIKIRANLGDLKPHGIDLQVKK